MTQDWDYTTAGCMELVVEASLRKYPKATKLHKLWDDNRDAMIALPLAATLAGGGRIRLWSHTMGSK